MADAVRSSRNTSQASADNCNLRPGKVRIGWRWSRGQDPVEKPLHNLVKEENGVLDEVFEEILEMHCGNGSSHGAVLGDRRLVQALQRRRRRVFELTARLGDCPNARRAPSL